MKRDLLPPLDGEAPLASTRVGATAWRRHVLALALVLAAMIVAYWRTGAQMVEIWSRSDTFAHAFVVPIIVAWLIWRQRTSWMRETPRPEPFWVIPFALCGLVWLCGEVATINAVSQLAFVGMLVCTVPAVLGAGVANRIAFPLAFLFFAVPIGEFMLPTLMQWTADFTVQALRLTGVPVYREGQQLIIPSGRWSVVEACSGIRYLIASFMIGTLYAYLHFSSSWRRAAFMGVSILIPIVANWIRAYTIVMIGHLSNNRLAVGVDHLIYGWLFFGAVMFLMFWAGSHWRETSPAVSRDRETGLRSFAPHREMGALVPGVLLVFALTWPLALHAIEQRMESSVPVVLDGIPTVAGWHVPDREVSTWQPAISAPSATLRQTFSDGIHTVGVHVAFFRNQSPGRKLVTSTNVLAGAGASETRWAMVAEKPTRVTVGARTIVATEAVLVGPRGDRLLALRWYWIDGRMTASEYVAKADMFLSRMRGRDDGAVVVVYMEEGPAARLALEAFLHDAAGELDRALQRATAAR